MLNLSLKELRLIAKNRNINGYKSMHKDKLFRIISENNKKDRKSLFKSKKEETKEIIQYKPTRISPFKLERKKVKKSLNRPAKKFFLNQ